MKEFFTTLQGKVITALTIIALVLGMAAEGVSMYRNAMEGETAAETARNAAKLKIAEAEERAQLAKKAAFDAETASQVAKKAAAEAETAREAANNAAKLKLAEAEKETQLAKKAAADAEAARAAANVSEEMQAATLAAKQAEARKLDGEATQAQFKACAMDDSKCTPEQRCIVEGENGVGSRYAELSYALTERLMGNGGFGISKNRKCAHLRNEAPATAAPARDQKIIDDCKRRLETFNERLKTHAAFAMTANGGCAWDGERPSIEVAVQNVLQKCAKANVHTCKIVATK